MSFWRMARRWPPAWCRLYARTRSKSPRLMTIDEIAERSGLPYIVVAQLASKLDWNNVTLDTIMAYLKGCDVDFCDSARMRQHSRLRRSKAKGKYRYLRRAPDWEHIRNTMEKLANGKVPK